MSAQKSLVQLEVLDTRRAAIGQRATILAWLSVLVAAALLLALLAQGTRRLRKLNDDLDHQRKELVKALAAAVAPTWAPSFTKKK